MIEVEINISPDEDGVKQLIAKSDFIREDILTDIYYDDPQYSLTTHDTWLRSRNNRFELKLPLNRETISLRAVDQYRELETNAEIKKALNLPPKKDLAESLAEANIKPCATIVTTRQVYKHGEFTIDLDVTDFGFSKGEIELLVKTEEEIASTKKKLTDFAAEHHIAYDISGAGKMPQYLKTHNQKHYNVLVAAGVIKGE
ncbi:MAG: CYTH domain-containing protein [bacterium]|nr:CYTH domain-containing protein [bacterium]